jgi:hypothetical protein
MPTQKVVVIDPTSPSGVVEQAVVLGQVIQAISGTVNSISGTTQTPFDNTAPLITEGFQLLSLNITPKSAQSRLFITCNLNVDHSVNNRTITACVYLGSSLVYTYSVNVATAGRPISLPIHTWVDTTDLTTKNLQIRVGANGNGTTYIGASPTVNLGGNRFSDYTVLEVLNV